MGGKLPRPRSVRWTDRDLKVLAAVQARLPGRSQHDLLSMGLIHLAETLRRDERVYLEFLEHEVGQEEEDAGEEQERESP